MSAVAGGLIAATGLKLFQSLRRHTLGFSACTALGLVCFASVALHEAKLGGPGSVAVAFDRISGVERWRALTASESGYCPPTMIEAGVADYEASSCTTESLHPEEVVLSGTVDCDTCTVCTCCVIS